MGIFTAFDKQNKSEEILNKMRDFGKSIINIKEEVTEC